ncbi:ATP-binding cassette domain-containing protein [Corynebacterium jeikeium]|jgi:ABC-2 type transport system ATP-binding protein|uniref:ATP-binding cassette domain-containing protein n=1 Tax=Corynebacterium jeikeium TaxID=38289 RepID=UPI0001B716C2|nr:ABC transporter ATP-binding protein [Corynebacterium jeikeium]EEW15596.1 ABC transporter, ATP-binding protein [Corynebacterium jeikeium ATCC 43734]OOD31190.1 ABC transporter ATP-binding protein [Corynebacterium jeikeium]WCZ52641.1 ABC transporter ATP-binding protein YtrB [Corynebacterium jeikeium]SUY82053.1 ABC transporter ATP-binding protein [Corynebacterium jeikeium]
MNSTQSPGAGSDVAPDIELRDVRRKLGSTHALDGATAHLPGGRVYGLIGRNGAGKTTLLRTIAGQLRAKGEVLIGGQPVYDNTQVLNSLILSGPDVPWPSDIKVKQLLSVVAARWETWDQRYADQLCEDFEVDTRKPLSKLSRGQKSLVSIVIGLAAQCPITLLDEPYLGLDVQNRELFYKHLLQDVERNPRTFILSTHHVEDAARILDSVILLDKGRITGVGTLDSITERIAILSGSAAAVEATLGEVGATGSVLMDATSSGLRRIVLDIHGLETDSVQDLAARIEGSGVRVTSADLEQAVLALTGREF